MGRNWTHNFSKSLYCAHPKHQTSAVGSNCHNKSWEKGLAFWDQWFSHTLCIIPCECPIIFLFSICLLKKTYSLTKKMVVLWNFLNLPKLCLTCIFMISSSSICLICVTTLFFANWNQTTHIYPRYCDCSKTKIYFNKDLFLPVFVRISGGNPIIEI